MTRSRDWTFRVTETGGEYRTYRSYIYQGFTNEYLKANPSTPIEHNCPKCRKAVNFSYGSLSWKMYDRKKKVWTISHTCGASLVLIAAGSPLKK